MNRISCRYKINDCIAKHDIQLQSLSAIIPLTTFTHTPAFSCHGSLQLNYSIQCSLLLLSSLGLEPADELLPHLFASKSERGVEATRFEGLELHDPLGSLQHQLFWLCSPHLDIPVSCERGEELELHLYWVQLRALLVVELEEVPTQGTAQVR